MNFISNCYFFLPLDGEWRCYSVQTDLIQKYSTWIWNLNHDVKSINQQLALVNNFLTHGLLMKWWYYYNHLSGLILMMDKLHSEKLFSVMGIVLWIFISKGYLFLPLDGNEGVIPLIPDSKIFNPNWCKLKHK